MEDLSVQGTAVVIGFAKRVPRLFGIAEPGPRIFVHPGLAVGMSAAQPGARDRIVGGDRFDDVV